MPNDEIQTYEEWKEKYYKKHGFLDWDKWREDGPRGCACGELFLFRLTVDEEYGYGNSATSSSPEAVRMAHRNAKRSARIALFVKYAELLNTIPNYLSCQSPCHPVVTPHKELVGSIGVTWIRDPDKGWWKKHAPLTPAGGRYVYISRGFGSMIVQVVCV